MTNDAPTAGFGAARLHAIQMTFFGVKELNILCFVPPDVTVGGDSQQIQLSVAPLPYDRETHIAEVTMGAQYGKLEEPNKTPFFLRVQIVAQFTVDEAKFPPDKVDDWARRAGPFVMYPYLREMVYGLTSRAGYNPLILPLLELPTAKQPTSPQEPKSPSSAT